MGEKGSKKKKKKAIELRVLIKSNGLEILLSMMTIVLEIPEKPTGKR